MTLPVPVCDVGDSFSVYLWIVMGPSWSHFGLKHECLPSKNAASQSALMCLRNSHWVVVPGLSLGCPVMLQNRLKAVAEVKSHLNDLMPCLGSLLHCRHRPWVIQNRSTGVRRCLQSERNLSFFNIIHLAFIA